MATLIELDDRGELHKFDPQLNEDQQELRLFYASPRLRNWIEGALPNLGATWDPALSPDAQFDALMAVYTTGATLTYGWTLKPLIYADEGVWELKTPDLRIFGWFAVYDCFVGVAAELAQTLKEVRGLYHGYAGDVVRFRAKLDLDEPKFVPGDDPHAVVSSFDYP